MTSISDKRQAILRAAAKVFAHKGLSQATIQDITREAGVAVGTFYLYFENKDELIQHLIGEIPRVIRSRLDATVNPIYDSFGFFEILDLVIDTILHTFTELKDLARIYILAPAMHPCACKEITENMAYYAQRTTQLVIRAIEQGEIRPVNPEILAAAIIGMIREVTDPHFFLDSTIDPTVLAKELKAFVRYGLTWGTAS